MKKFRKSDVVLRAKQFCKIGRHRLTEPRERVLSLLAHAACPMGAYQILASLSSCKATMSPPTVYRAIEFWVQHGFIHKVQSMNAYMVCSEPHYHDNCCIFICDDCQKVIELKMQHLPLSIEADIANQDLTIARSNTEIHGMCGECC